MAIGVFSLHQYVVSFGLTNIIQKKFDLKWHEL
jgi:hypothetical protein